MAVFGRLFWRGGSARSEQTYVPLIFLFTLQTTLRTQTVIIPRLSKLLSRYYYNYYLGELRLAVETKFSSGCARFRRRGVRTMTTVVCPATGS